MSSVYAQKNVRAPGGVVRGCPNTHITHLDTLLYAAGEMASANFKVQQICSVEEMAAVFVPRAIELGWEPGAMDHVSFFSTDESGFYAGELDGKIVETSGKIISSN